MTSAAASSALAQADLDAGAGSTGQDETPSFVEDVTPGFELQLTAGIHLGRASGSITNGPDGIEPFLMEKVLDLDDYEATFNAELLFRKDRLDILLSGFDFSTDNSLILAEPITFGALALDAGDSVEATFDLFSAAIDVRYAFYLPPNDDPDITFRIAPSLSLRYVDLDQSITSGGVRESASASATALLPGLFIDFAFREKLFIGGGTAFGPNLDGGSQWWISASIGYHFTPNLGVSIGYRQLDFDIEEDDYEADGRIAGLFIAGSIRF